MPPAHPKTPGQRCLSQGRQAPLRAASGSTSPVRSPAKLRQRRPMELATGGCQVVLAGCALVCAGRRCGHGSRTRLKAQSIAAPSAEASIPEAAAAAWHAARRRAILEAHPEVADCCGPDWRTLPLLVFANCLQLAGAVWSGMAIADSGGDLFVVLAVICFAAGVGGTMSLWSFACLHDLVHGTMVRADRATREAMLFWLSFPTIFGYHLYLQRGHLSHHRNLGRASAGQLFDSSRREFEDGDVLFVAHRQPLAGKPFEVNLPLPSGDSFRFSPSVSHNVFTRFWEKPAGGTGAAGGPGSKPASATTGLRNAFLYTFSMVLERFFLAINDKFVALLGTNVFFMNKPSVFHEGCANYARAAAVLHLLLFVLTGPGSLLYLFVAEVAWQLPFHPGCAMFVSNHGSGRCLDGRCAPSSSLYIGGPWGWYDWVCMFSNYHLEHHDFPDVGLLQLPAIRKIAPEFYGSPAPESKSSSEPPPRLAVATAASNWLEVVQSAFAAPQPYACSFLEGIDDGYDGEEDSATWAARAA